MASCQQTAEASVKVICPAYDTVEDVFGGQLMPKRACIVKVQ